MAMAGEDGGRSHVIPHSVPQAPVIVKNHDSCHVRITSIACLRSSLKSSHLEQLKCLLWLNIANHKVMLLIRYFFLTC